MKPRPLFFSYFLYTHIYTPSRRNWSTCFWLWQWHHPPCGQSPVPLSGLELLTHTATLGAAVTTETHTHTLSANWKRECQKKKERKEWGIISLIKDDSTLTAWILGAVKINSSPVLFSLLVFSLLTHLPLPPFLVNSPQVSPPLLFLPPVSRAHPLLLLSIIHLLTLLQRWIPSQLTKNTSWIWRRKEVSKKLLYHFLWSLMMQ